MEPTSGNDVTAAAPRETSGAGHGLSREIDLLGVFSHLWRSRWLIFLLALLGAAAALAYASESPKSYVAVAKIREPSPIDLAPINEIGILSIGPREAYRAVIDVLNTEDLLMQIYQDQLAARDTKLGGKASRTNNKTPDNLDRMINIKLPRNLRTSFYNSDISDIVVRHPDAGFAVQLANGLVDSANAIATQNLIEEGRQLLQIRLDSIDEKLQQLRQLSATSSTDGAYVSTEMPLAGDSTRADLIRNGASTTETHRYESDFFNETLDELRYQHALLTTYKTRSFADLSLVSVYKPASLPADLTGPGTFLLTVMGLFAGTLCGFTVALLLVVKRDLPGRLSTRSSASGTDL